MEVHSSRRLPWKRIGRNKCPSCSVIVCKFNTYLLTCNKYLRARTLVRTSKYQGWWEKNPNHDRQISTVDMVFTKEWESCLYALWRYYNYGVEDEKQTLYMGLTDLTLGYASTVGSTSSKDPVITQLLSEFKTKLPLVFRDPTIMMLKGNATHPMIPVHHQQRFPYGLLTSTNTTADLRIAGNLLRQLYNDLSVKVLEDVEYFSTSNMLNASTYANDCWMYSNNNLTRVSGILHRHQR